MKMYIFIQALMYIFKLAFIGVNVKINMYIFACLSMYKINHFL
ncbi:hypothetical protein COM72_16330, partial [Bacillus thuringiensis]